ncbi:MAG TPA: biotin/lipoyl-binding protein [bacterium]|nr:biotin/lipoyl-binding protein [bacterium]
MKIYKYKINGNPYEVNIKRLTDDSAVVEVNGTEYQVDILLEHRQRKTPQLMRSHPVHETDQGPSKTIATERVATSGMIKAPLPGLILELMVKEGDEVSMGQTIVKMEAMKMENNIQSNRQGKVTAVRVKPGDSVLEGAVLLEIGG